MAASWIHKPGTGLGPCKSKCKHIDCAGSRKIAETICRFCVKPIGYDERFLNDDGYVHESCLEDSIEAQQVA